MTEEKTAIDESRIELLVVFQEKLVLKMNDSDFRREILEPMLASGIDNENLSNIIREINQDDEVSEIITSLKEKGRTDESINKELKILLEKLIERFSKFRPEETDQFYIG